MKKSILTLLLFGFLFASTLNAEESTPLSVYSGGLFLGNLQPVSDPLQKDHSQFLQVGMIHSWIFHPMLSMDLSADLTFPERGWGTELGFSFRYPMGMFIPFVAVSGGVRDLSRKEQPFDNSFGAAGTLRAGMLFFPDADYHFFVQGHFRAVQNQMEDRSMGVSIGLMLDGSRKGIRKVKL